MAENNNDDITPTTTQNENMPLVMEWVFEDMVEVILDTPDDFLKIRETLTRIGIAGIGNKLYQTCNILHKRGKYYIVHFKELFALDGKITDIPVDDIRRRNTIVKLLDTWGLLNITDDGDDNINVIGGCGDDKTRSKITFLKFREKDEWELIPKYNIGTKKHQQQQQPSCDELSDNHEI